MTRHGIRLSFGAFLICGWALAQTDEQAQIDFADGLFARGFNEEAAEEYRAYLKAHPSGQYRAAAFYRLGESESALKNYDAALEALDQALATDAQSEFAGRAQLRRGAVLLEAGRPDDAVKSLQPLIGDANFTAHEDEALYYLGRAHAVAQRTASAVGAFSRLMGDHPESPFASMGRYQLAFAYVSQGDLEKAAVEFSEIGAMPGASDALRMEAYFRAGEAYDKLGWFESAVKTYDRLESEFPASAYAQRARYGHAWSLYQAGQIEPALIAAREFSAAYPESTLRPSISYLIGNALQERGRYDEALVVYAELIAAHPGSEFAVGARYKTAWAHYLNGDGVAARSQADAFIAEAPDSPLVGDTLYLKGLILFESDSHSDALNAFREIQASHANGEFAADAAFQTGLCLEKLGRPAEAAAAFNAFATAHPEHHRIPTAHLHAGDAHFRAGAFADAVQSYTQAATMAEAGPAHEEALHRLATAHHNLGAYTESAQTFQTLLESYAAGRHAAEANLRTGDYWLREGSAPLDAVPYFERSFEVAPKGPFAGEALRGLALARYESKDLDGAAQTFVRVISGWKDIRLNEKTYVWVGQHLYDREEWDQARLAFETLIASQSDYPNPERILYKIAQCTEHTSETGEAMLGYARVVEAAPGSPSAADARFQMARLHEAGGDLAEATALYEEGANANSGETAARARFRLGEIFEDKEDYGTAAKHFMRVAILFLHPELSPESLWRAAYCFEQGADLEQARRTYQEVLDEYPESEQAKKAQAQLKGLGAP